MGATMHQILVRIQGPRPYSGIGMIKRLLSQYPDWGRSRLSWESYPRFASNRSKQIGRFSAGFDTRRTQGAVSRHRSWRGAKRALFIVPAAAMLLNVRIYAPFAPLWSLGSCSRCRRPSACATCPDCLGG